MSTVLSSGTLLVREIREANLSWVRRDLGSLDELRESIKQDGLLLPILTTPDMLVVDGARRLEACAQLGWKAVPAIATSDWNKVKRYYEQAQEMAREGVPHLPMSWLDLADLCNGPLKEMYGPELRRLRGEVRQRNAKARPKKVEGVNDKPNFYVNASAEVLGFKPKDLREIRMIMNGLARLRRPADRGEDQVAVKQRHAWADYIDVQLRESEQNGGDRLSAVLARVRAANNGQDPAQIREARGRRNVGDPTLSERRARVAAAAPGRELDGSAMKNIAQLLEHVALTVHGYTYVRPTVPPREAAEAAAEMKAAIQQINGLIRVVRTYGAVNPNLEERA